MSEAPGRALICGISGQDGAYLASLLLEKGYEVFGTSRNPSAQPFANLQALRLAGRVAVVEMDGKTQASVMRAIATARPTEIYMLSAQSSVGRSFEYPLETFESIVPVTANLLEAVRLSGLPIRLYNAGSSECFGDTGEGAADEQTPFHPQSPYASAKAAAHQLVATYRTVYGIHACSGITFNHESPLRPPQFVTSKIVSGAARIAERGGKLLLGPLDVMRDWGWAPEYVEAMWRMLQQPSPNDYVIATGRSVSLRYFVERAFARFGLHWTEHVEIDPAMRRPWEIARSSGNPERARKELQWRARSEVETVIDRLCDAAASISCVRDAGASE